MSVLSENFAKIRRFYNYSQADLGKLFGVSARYVSECESGTRFPSNDYIHCFCQYFHIYMNRLLSENVRLSEGFRWKCE